MSTSQGSESQPVLKNFVPYKPKKGEEYMNEKQRDHFKRILLDWREQLMQEVDRTVHHMQDDAANYPDPADRATQEEEFKTRLLCNQCREGIVNSHTGNALRPFHQSLQLASLVAGCTTHDARSKPIRRIHQSQRMGKVNMMIDTDMECYKPEHSWI